MKVSREQAALNRERIVDVAARLFREKGYDGIGVLTHLCSPLIPPILCVRATMGC